MGSFRDKMSLVPGGAASSCCLVQALFFEVTAEKADHLCSTS